MTVSNRTIEDRVAEILKEKGIGELFDDNELYNLAKRTITDQFITLKNTDTKAVIQQLIKDLLVKEMTIYIEKIKNDKVFKDVIKDIFIQVLYEQVKAQVYNANYNIFNQMIDENRHHIRSALNHI